MNLSISRDRSFWLQWVAAGALGFGLFAGLFGTMDAAGGEGSLLQRLGLVIGSVSFGFPQALVLRKRTRLAGWWLVTPAVGLVLDGAVGYPLGSALGSRLAGPLVDFTVAGVTTLLTTGVMTGLLQWLILRRLFTRAAGCIPVSCLGWLLGGIISLAIALALGIGAQTLQWGIAAFALQVSLLELAGGAVMGAITGAYLVRLFQKHKINQ